jgi:myo-inositol-1(or 4)-monophosphatase
MGGRLPARHGRASAVWNGPVSVAHRLGPDDIGPDEATLEEIAIAVAVDAAGFVGERAAGAGPSSLGVVDRKSSATDLVTEVDRATEARLIAAIRARRPHDGILGEESGRHPGAGGSAPGDDHRLAADAVDWVIDPIDGTVNFVLGLPAYSVSVAARVGGQSVAGCVVDVVRGDVYHARRGGGAWCRGVGSQPAIRLHGPRAVPLAEAVVATGFAYDAAARTRQAQVLVAVLGRIGNIRRLGSAALDMCLAGAGRVDAYFEAGLNDWDRAAGLLIAAEAGLRTDVLPAPGGGLTVAARPAIYDEFVRLLITAGADQVMTG